jgi:hypothetical protein
LKIGVKHVLNFSRYNYILFLVLLLFSYSFKAWRKICWLLISFVVSYFIALILSISFDVKTNLEIIKFLIPLSLFAISILKILNLKSQVIKKDKVGFLGSILFGFFNGLGFSNGFKFKISSNENELLPILEALFGVSVAVLLMATILVIIFSFLHKIAKIQDRNLVLIFSGSTVILSLLIMFKQLIL